MKLPSSGTSPKTLVDSYGEDMLAFLSSWPGNPAVRERFQVQQEILREIVERQDAAGRAAVEAALDLDEAGLFLAEVLRLLKSEAVSHEMEADGRSGVLELFPKSSRPFTKAGHETNLALAERLGKILPGDSAPSVRAFIETLQEACREVNEARSAVEGARGELSAAAAAAQTQAREWLAAYQEAAEEIRAEHGGTNH